MTPSKAFLQLVCWSSREAREAQKEGQEDQGEVKELGGTPLRLFGSPGPPGLPSGSSLAALDLHIR